MNAVICSIGLVIGTIISSLIGGKIYLDQTGSRLYGEPNYGAFVAIFGVAVTIWIFSNKVKTLTLQIFKALWIASAFIYVVCLFVGFYGALDLSLNADIDLHSQSLYTPYLIDQFERENDREPTQQDFDNIKDQAKAFIKKLIISDSFYQAEAGDLYHQIFWGPVFVSCLFACLYYRLKSKLKFESIKEKLLVDKQEL